MASPPKARRSNPFNNSLRRLFRRPRRGTSRNDMINV